MILGSDPGSEPSRSRLEVSLLSGGGHHFATIIFCALRTAEVSINGVFKVCFENSHHSATHPTFYSIGCMHTPRLPDVNDWHARARLCAVRLAQQRAHTVLARAAGHGMLLSAWQPTKPQ